MKLKIYRLLAQQRTTNQLRLFNGDIWDAPIEITIVSTSITKVYSITKESAIIEIDDCPYKITREDFDKIFEIEDFNAAD